VGGLPLVAAEPPPGTHKRGLRLTNLFR
jgi:hypothetical protein